MAEDSRSRSQRALDSAGEEVSLTAGLPTRFHPAKFIYTAAKQARKQMDFTGRHVVITGASSGIGRATAARIAFLGGRVTLIARRAVALAAACGEIGAGASYVVADVGDQAQILAAIDAAVARNG